MATPGRKPKSREQKVLEGNPGKRALPKETVKPKGLASCPPWLDGVAKTEWKRLSQELELLGLLSSVDQMMFAGYCQAYSQWRKASLVIAKKGMTFECNGMVRKRPEVQIANEAMRQMRHFATEFGMSPSARTRVTPSNQLPLPGMDQSNGKPEGQEAQGEEGGRFFGLRAVS